MNKIDSRLWEQATKLASRNYRVEYSQDTLTDGQVVHLVSNPELRGCMAQSDELEKALYELALARANYIYFRLLDGKSIPEPQPDRTSTGATTATRPNFTITGSGASGGTITMHQFENFLNTIIQPDSREKIASVSVVEGSFENPV